MDNISLLDARTSETVHQNGSTQAPTERVRHPGADPETFGILLHRKHTSLVSPSISPRTTNPGVTTSSKSNEEDTPCVAMNVVEEEDSLARKNSAAKNVPRCESPAVEIISVREIRGIRASPSMDASPGSARSNGHSKPAPVDMQGTASKPFHGACPSLGQAHSSLTANAKATSHANTTNELVVPDSHDVVASSLGCFRDRLPNEISGTPLKDHTKVANSGPSANKRPVPFSSSSDNKRSKMDAKSNVSNTTAVVTDPVGLPRYSDHLLTGCETSGLSGSHAKSQGTVGPSQSSVVGPGIRLAHSQSQVSKGKKWGPRSWNASQYAALAQACEYGFPFSAFESKHNKSRAEVLEVFTSIIQTPLLAHAGHGTGTPRGGLGEKLVKEHRQKEKDVSEYQAKLAVLQQKDKDKEKHAIRQEVERQVWARLDAEGWVRVGKEKERGLGEKANDNETDGLGMRSTRGRKPTRTKTVDEATAELQAASVELMRATKAEERRAKIAEKKERESGNLNKGKVERRRCKDEKGP